MGLRTDHGEQSVNKAEVFCYLGDRLNADGQTQEAESAVVKLKAFNSNREIQWNFPS